jgi:hypothetical protein
MSLQITILQIMQHIMDKLYLTGRALGQVFNFRSGCMHTMHLLPSVAIRPNLEFKTRPKQLLGSLPLVIALPSIYNIGTLISKLDHFIVVNIFSVVI